MDFGVKKELLKFVVSLFFLKRETLDNIVRWAKTAGGYIFQCSAAIVPIRSLGRPYGRTIHNNSQARKILWIYIYI